VKVLIVSGIWPPDVGGPASHAPEVVDWLRGRGHDVAVVTTGPPRGPGVHAVPRTALRYPRIVAAIARRAARSDVAYAVSMVQRTAAACTAARTPFVAKLSSDVAYDRARRRGLFSGSLEEFQSARAPAVTASKTVRAAALRRAAHVVTPSAFLRDLALRWGVPSERLTVLPNPVPALRASDPVEEAATFVFAGRLTAAKALGTALEALARVEGPSLAVVGDGEERESLERKARELGLNGRVEFLGAQPRERVLALLGSAQAVVLTSAWENFPNVVVEALASGTPVIATAVGGVGEIVSDGENGLLVPPGDPEAFAAAIRRFLAEPELRERLRARAASSVERFRPDRVFARLEEILGRAVGQ
jgi:glycosyltransferase involved in cell wall biosynthesis